MQSFDGFPARVSGGGAADLNRQGPGTLGIAVQTR